MLNLFEAPIRTRKVRKGIFAYLYRNCPADLHMTRQVNWGVTDWTIALR